MHTSSGDSDRTSQGGGGIAMQLFVIGRLGIGKGLCNGPE